jgi:hypothetical protein
MEDAMTSLRKRTFLALGALLAALPFASVASGQARDEYGDYSDVAQADVIQTVARISHVQGNASYARGDDPENWQPADVNIPMTLGDRVYTDQHSRLELQVHGGDVIWLGSRTDLTALNLTNDTKQFAVKSGIGTFQIRRVDENDTWEVDTPNASVTFDQPGTYRIDVDANGNTRVSVQRGAATVAAGGGQIVLSSGEAMAIDGIDSPRYDVLAVSSQDAWDRWVDDRSGRYGRSPSAHYVSADIVGADDLDQYGSWQTIPEYGNVWSPSRVDAGWAPYRQGHWAWQDPWGWTWISVEPWGWAPYHYGRWVNSSSRWFWVPVAASVQTVAYSPALVAFVGGGPDFSASVTIGGGGYVGWFPLAPRDPLAAWWSPRPAVNVNVTNVTYVNQTYVTVVNQNTFVSSGLVARNMVTDRNVLRQVAMAPVIRGAVPVIPTVASTRVAFSAGVAAPRPPTAVMSRAVVARVAPPPAPPNFQEKLAAIRENRRPVDPAAASRITTQTQAQPRASAAIRPVVAQSGRVTLAPRNSSPAASARAQAVAPVPATSLRGRPMATAQQPVAAGMVTGNRSRAAGAATPEQAAPPANRPGVPDARPSVERERAAPARPESRAEPPRAQEPAQTAPYAVRPTPANERLQREVATPNRPNAERQRVPVPPQSDERLRPTARVEQPNRPGPPESRVRPEAAPAQTPNWRERTRPTPQVERPSREAAPPREHVQQEPPQRERVVTPPPSREVVRPESRRPPERAPRSGTPRPKPTPRNDERNPN